MSKIITYIFFAIGLAIAMGLICFIGYGVWLYWDLNHNWASSN